jgi:hypothetical protein
VPGQPAGALNLSGLCKHSGPWLVDVNQADVIIELDSFVNSDGQEDACTPCSKD